MRAVENKTRLGREGRKIAGAIIRLKGFYQSLGGV